jgi:hypothetical protein
MAVNFITGPSGSQSLPLGVSQFHGAATTNESAHLPTTPSTTAPATSRSKPCDVTGIETVLRQLRDQSDESPSQEGLSEAVESSPTPLELIRNSDPSSFQPHNPSGASVPVHQKAGSRHNHSKKLIAKGGNQINVRWNNRMVEVLMDTLRRHSLDGKAAKGGFKASTWNACVNIIRPHYHGGGEVTAKSCRNKFGYYKRIWRLWKAHCQSIPEWGLNDDGVPVNESEVEDSYFTDHPDRAIFRDNLPPYHNHLIDIDGDSVVATGAHAHGPDSDSGGDGSYLNGTEVGDEEDEVRSRRESTSGSMSSGRASTSPGPQRRHSSIRDRSLGREATKRTAERTPEKRNSKRTRCSDQFVDELQKISTESASRLKRTVERAIEMVEKLEQRRPLLEEAIVILNTDFRDQFSEEDAMHIISSFREEANVRILLNLGQELRLPWLLRLLQEEQGRLRGSSGFRGLGGL